MKFEEALNEFRIRLAEEYGPGREVTKIGVTKELYYDVLKESILGKSGIMLEKLSEFKMYGIEIVIREKDYF